MNNRERRLEKELGFHVEQHAADLIARGVDPAEARRQARLELGGPEQVKERCREVRPTRWIEETLRDLRYALRTLRQKPGFASVALLTLALGVGGATVMFTVVNGVLLKPLPYPDPARLIAVHGHSNTWNAALYGEQNLNYLDFLDCQRQIRSADLAGWVFNSGTLSGSKDPEHVVEHQISSNLFSVLGVPVYAGRAFSPEEDRAGSTPVAILGYSLWQRRFGGSSGALGSGVELDGKRFTVIGVAARDFRLADEEADIYTPVGQNTAPYMRSRRAHPVWGIARLRSGAALGQARAELSAIAGRLAGQFPATNKERSFIADVLKPDAGDVGPTLWLLLGAVAVVFAIACVNIASLLLARAVARERELAMRMALRRKPRSFNPSMPH